MPPTEPHAQSAAPLVADDPRAANPHQGRAAILLSWAARLTVAASLYVALTALVFRRLLPDMDHLLLGPPEDNLQDLWNTWYWATHVRSLADVLHTTMIKFPEGTPLYYHSFAYPKMLVMALLGPAVAASPEAVLTSHNLLLMVSFPVSALGAFCLVRHFTGEDAGALVGGALFAFNPYQVENALHHMHVSSIEFIPFFALFFILADERRSAALLVLSVACYALSALSSWYYLFYGLYFMAFYYAFRAYRRRAWPGRRELAVLAAHPAGLALVAAPLLVPMITVAASGADVYAEGSAVYVADLAGYVAFPPLHLFGPLAGWVHANTLGTSWESVAYLGLVNLGLLAWLFTRRAGDERERVLRLFVIGGMLVFAVFASGDWLRLFAKRLVPMPSMLLSQLPFFMNVRTPSRAMVFTYLFLSIGVGAAIAAMRQAWAGRRHGWAAIACLVLLAAIDWYPVDLPATPFACPPAYRIVASDPDPDFAVLDLPLGYVALNAAMAYQSCHGRPIVGGVVSREPTRTLRDRLITHDLQAQRRQLAESGVKYVVIHRQQNAIFRWPTELGTMDAYLAAYRVQYSGPEAILLQVDR